MMANQMNCLILPVVTLSSVSPHDVLLNTPLIMVRVIQSRPINATVSISAGVSGGFRYACWPRPC